jgi:hypothetical protein
MLCPSCVIHYKKENEIRVLPEDDINDISNAYIILGNIIYGNIISGMAPR